MGRLVLTWYLRVNLLTGLTLGAVLVVAHYAGWIDLSRWAPW